MKHLAVLLLLFCIAHITVAQHKPIQPGQQFLFNYDKELEIDKFYREHVPLDGAAVRYIPFRRDSLFGFVDKYTGATKIAPKYTQVYAVYPEGSIVEYHGWYGLVNYSDSFIIPPVFSNLYREDGIYHGLLTPSDTSYPSEYQTYNYNCYATLKGEYLFHTEAHEQQEFMPGDSLTWYRFGPDYFIINRKGTVLRQFTWQKDSLFLGICKNTLVCVQRNAGAQKGADKYYSGFSITGKQEFKIQTTVDAFMLFRINDTTYGAFNGTGITFLNATGTPYPYYTATIPSVYALKSFLHTLLSLPFFEVVQPREAHQRRSGNYGLLSKDGAVKIPLRYSFMGPVIRGEVAFFDSVSGKIGFMDTNGKVTARPCLSVRNLAREQMVDLPLAYSEDLCLAYDTTRSVHNEGYTVIQRLCYFDRSGNIALHLPDSVISAGPFSSGLAPIVLKSGGLGFINKKGKIVIPCKYAIAVEGAYPLPQVVMPSFIHGYAYLKAFKGYIDSSGREYFSGRILHDEYNFSH